MISKSISTSTKLADVSLFARLLFTWLIPHCDDYGRMDGSSKIVRGIVVPLGDEGPVEVEAALIELEKVALIKRYDVAGKTYLQVEKWNNHQTLRSDRPLQSVYPTGVIGTPEGAKGQTKRKVREGKVREGKTTESLVASLKYLSNVPEEDITELIERFEITRSKVLSVAEDLKLYCQRKAKTYRNYKAFLLNAVKRDFKERVKKAPEKPKEEEKPMTEEQKRRVAEIKSGISAIAKQKTMLS